LRINANNNPPRHVSVEGWPQDDEGTGAGLLLRQKLAELARLVIR
jgi:hypothetical protein